jgi:hypothetical protein
MEIDLTNLMNNEVTPTLPLASGDHLERFVNAQIQRTAWRVYMAGTSKFLVPIIAEQIER